MRHAAIVLVLLFPTAYASDTFSATFPAGTEMEIKPLALFSNNTQDAKYFRMEIGEGKMTVVNVEWTTISTPLVEYNTQTKRDVQEFQMKNAILIGHVGENTGFLGIYPSVLSTFSLVQDVSSETRTALHSVLGNGDSEPKPEPSMLLFSKETNGPHLLTHARGGGVYEGEGKVKFSGLDFSYNGATFRTGHDEGVGWSSDTWVFIDFQDGRISTDGLSWEIASAEMKVEWDGEAIFTGNHGLNHAIGEATLSPIKRGREIRVEERNTVNVPLAESAILAGAVLCTIALGAWCISKERTNEDFEAAYHLMLAGGPKETVLSLLEKAIGANPNLKTYLQGEEWKPLRSEERFLRIQRDADATNK